MRNVIDLQTVTCDHWQLASALTSIQRWQMWSVLPGATAAFGAMAWHSSQGNAWWAVLLVLAGLIGIAVCLWMIAARLLHASSAHQRLMAVHNQVLLAADAEEQEHEEHGQNG